MVARGHQYYSVCGENSVWVLTLSADREVQVQTKHRIQGKVRALFLQADEVWVASSHESAQPLRDTAVEVLTMSVAGPASAPLQQGVGISAEAEDGVVTQVRNQEVTVSLGKAQGLKLGDRVAIYTTKAVPLDEGLQNESTREEIVLVGTVTAISDSRARVAAGFGEMAEPGMRARVTSQARTVSRLAPERIGDQLVLEGSVRPFLPIDNLAFAMQGDLAATYLPAMDAYAKVELKPLGLFLGSDNTAGYAGAYASAGYDQTYFSLGLGVGMLYSQRLLEDYDSYYDESPARTEGQTLFSVLQSVRLGARDGLHFSVSTALAIQDDRWTFGWIECQGQLPVGSRSWVVVHGSGSPEPGYFYTEFGFRRMVRGNGGPGSLFLRPSAGVAGMENNKALYDSLSMGPMIALHVEGRLAR